MDLGSVQKVLVFSGLLRKAVSKASDRNVRNENAITTRHLNRG